MNKISKSFYKLVCLSLAGSVLIGFLIFYIPVNGAFTREARISFQNAVNMKALEVDFVLSTFISTAKSLGSRSAIRQKLIEYHSGAIGFTELCDFSAPKYADGAAAISHLRGASRYLPNGSLIAAWGDNRLLSSYLQERPGLYRIHEDNLLVFLVISQIVDGEKYLGYDACVFDAEVILSGVSHEVISFEIEDGLSSKEISDELTSIVALAEKPFVLVGKANQEIFFSASKNALTGVAAYTLCLFLFVTILSYFTFFRFVQNLIAEHIESEQSYRNQFANNSAVMLLIDPADGAIIDANAASFGFYGYTHEQLLTMHITDINTLPVPEVLQAMTSILPKDGKRFEFQHRLSDGSLRDVEVSSSRIQFARRTVLHSIIHDITERKLAEELLRQATDRLTLAARAGGVGIWDYDVVNNRLVWDEQMFRLYGITQDRFSGAYEAWLAGFHPEDRQAGDEEIKIALRGEKDFDTEFRVVWPDETIHDIRALALVKRDASGQPLHLIGTNWDITAQKQAEESLRILLSEKEMLLKEVHHRVKNNLAAIMGLLDMQGRMLDNEPGKAAFAELSNRIRSMALVHEHLYQSKDLSRINFQDYLDTLISHLRSSYNSSTDIHVSVTAAGVDMGLDCAIPCGLLITELMTNAFKYAFPAGLPHSGTGRCEIVVSAEWDGATYTLIVADNGVGLPASLNWTKTKTLGLLLVRMLGQHQLQGQIELDCTSGTSFCLRFKKLEYAF